MNKEKRRQAMKRIDNVINYLPKDIKNVIETHCDKD